jgi:hypothetical protein
VNREEVFSVWAPAESPWSPWVAPVLFALTFWDTRIEPEQVPALALPWCDVDSKHTVCVVDLPAAESVQIGFAMARRGFRPVPLFNASPGPEEIVGLGAGSASVWNAVIDMGPIVEAIAAVTSSLKRLAFSPQASATFLLDSQRLTKTRVPDKGMFDNRWMVFPQDFPSARFLLARDIRQVLLVQRNRVEPQDDLAHVLLRWQEAGLKILSKDLADDALPSPISVRRPSRFKAVWYRALAQVGLRRSSAGGFGSYIPEATASG